MNLYERIKIENRSTVLGMALLIESTVSMLLSQLLDINDYKKTKSFGGGSEGLSYNQKINLLIDIGALRPNTKTKLQKFMEVRNKFMHDIDVSTFADCVDAIKSESWFRKNGYFTGKGKNREEECRIAIANLMNDVHQTIETLFDRADERSKMKYEIELNEKKTEFIDEAVKEALELIYEVLNREQQTKYIAASELPKWGKTLSYVVQRALSYKANLFLKEKYTTNTMVEPPNQ